MKHRWKEISVAAALAAGAAVAPAPALAQADSAFTIEACNKDSRPVAVALAYRETGQTVWVNEGFFIVDPGKCNDLAKTDNKIFYVYAEIRNQPEEAWKGDVTRCIKRPGPFKLTDRGGTTCGTGEVTLPFRKETYTARVGGRHTINLLP